MSDRLTGVSLAGKHIFWNINKSKNGAHYLTIVAKKDKREEKLTLFDSQIPSFVHKTMEAYGEICRLNQIPLFPGSLGVEPQVPEPKEEDPFERVDMECGKCGRHPSKWYIEQGLDPLGSVHVYVSDETGAFVMVRCQECGWTPDDSSVVKVGKVNYGSFKKNSTGYELWSPWAE